ncbi:MAG TPA: SDR family oxidoreductase [Chondromyces sp.]|nr:SDR family oxidoreductase [Chondromyces sp.]
MAGSEMGIAGKVAVVTGGSSGIGRAVAVALVERGVRVVVVGLTQARVSAVAGALRARSADPGDVLPLTLDVRSESDMEQMAHSVLSRFGRIDLLVAAAGVARRPGSQRLVPYPAAQLPIDEWDAILDTNLRGTFLADRAVLPTMQARGSGTIVNVSSSPGGYRGQAFAAPYCASKFGVRGLTQSLAEEVRRLGIKVHCILPDAIDTPLLDRSTLAARLGTPLAPERVAELVVSLWTEPQDSQNVEPVLLPARRPAALDLRRDAGWEWKR